MSDSHELSIDFLYRSIEDTQNIIRAIDIKVGFLFAVNIIPISYLDKITNNFCRLSPVEQYLFWFATFVWVTSIYVLFRTIVSISSPDNHIRGARYQKGSFYMSSLFEFYKKDIFYNSDIESTENIGDKVRGIPKDYSEIIKELTFEKMKVSYIRDIKLKRSTYCFYSTFFCIFLGIIIVILGEI
jgi:hypothetical protein